jgi:hypothetical protein
LIKPLKIRVRKKEQIVRLCVKPRRRGAMDIASASGIEYRGSNPARFLGKALQCMLVCLIDSCIIHYLLVAKEKKGLGHTKKVSF